jgi:hypothetical protein
MLGSAESQPHSCGYPTNGEKNMKTKMVRLLVLAAMLVAGSGSLLTAEGPVPQPMCVPGDVGCPK